MKKAFFFFLGLCLSVSIFAQKGSLALPSKCIPVPDFIDYKIADNSWKDKYGSYQEYVEARVKSGNYQSYAPNAKAWVVFSDRDKNITYDRPHGSAHSRLSFMQKVYIADIKDGWALVFTDVHFIGDDLKINSSADVKGWLPIEHLLLWNKCPQTAQKILEKGLIIQDLKQISKTDAQNSGQIKYLSAPNESAEAYGDARQLEIPFIMKKVQENGQTYYLLSTISEIDDRGNTQSSIVPGWLPEKFVTPWNQRMCLETAAENVPCLKSSSIYPAIFENLPDAKAFVENPQQGINRCLKKYDENIRSGQRPHGYILRSPILSNEDASNIIYRAVGIGTNEETRQATDVATTNKKLEQLKNKLHNVNIVFVLDATNSMKPYFNEISKALNELLKTDFSHSVRVGIVVYRNEADGAQEIEFRRLTENIGEIANFVDQTECKSKGKGYQESFYKGLETALDMKRMGYEANQSNFIIAVGDCGNKDDDKRQQEIGRKFKDNNIDFFAYNVGIGMDDAYWQYTHQVVKLLRLSIDQNNDCVNLEGKQQDLYRIFAKSGSVCTNNLSKTHFGGARLASDQNIRISAFKSSVKETVKNFVDYTTNQIAYFENLKTGKLKTDGSWEWDNMAIVLKRRGFSDKEIKIIRENGAPSKYVGFMPMKADACSETLFNYTLFFSHAELSSLVQELVKINPDKSQTGIEDDKATRAKYQTALITLGRSFLGESEDKVKSMNFDELLQKIYGIPVKINTCRIRSIKDITNPNIVSGTDFRNFASGFYSQTRKLENILNSDYRESFATNGKIYYWIPFNSMPGYCAE